MIGSLRGYIVKISSDFILLEVSGVGYKVFCSKSLLMRLKLGEKLFLYTEYVVGEDFQKLYGFDRQSEQDWFLTLCSVQGVGAKAALSILSVCSPSDILNAIMLGDKSVITKAQGVGPKLADRLINELKAKKDLPSIYELDERVEISSQSQDNAILEIKPVENIQVKKEAFLQTEDLYEKRIMFENAVSALVNLGYARSEVQNIVAGSLVDLEEPNEALLIKTCLQQFARLKEGAL